MKIFAPFTKDQINSLTHWQNDDTIHPFTCPNDSEKLIPRRQGWYCSKCNYTQNWVHDFMVEDIENGGKK